MARWLIAVLALVCSQVAWSGTINLVQTDGLLSTKEETNNDLNAPNFPALPADNTFKLPFEGSLTNRQGKFFRYTFYLPEGYTELSFKLELNVNDEFAVYLNDHEVAMQDDADAANFQAPFPGFELKVNGSSSDTSGGKLDFLSINHSMFKVGVNELTIYAGDVLDFGGFTGMTATISFNSHFFVNPGVNDAWFNLATAGQGFFFVVFPDLGLFFLSWFTFDTELPAQGVIANLGFAGHRWVTAIGDWGTDTVTLEVELTEGGVFDSEDPAVTQTPGYGTITIVFHDCNHATLTYNFPTLGLMGQIELTRVAGDNVPLCEELNAAWQEGG